MDLDKYQQAWQADESRTKVTIDADLLRQEVQRNQRDFRATTASRDVREISVALLMLPAWFYWGVTEALPWTWYLTIPALLWVVGYILVYRMRHKQEPIRPDEPLLDCVKRSLTEVDDQIWLLRNVFWWYLLPIAVPVMIFTVHLSLLKAKHWTDALVDANAFVLVFFVAFFYLLYYLNQRAVDTQLQPRRQELLDLLASLGDESADEHEVANHTEPEPSAGRSTRWLIVAASWLLAVVVLAVAGGVFDASFDEPPKSSGPTGEFLAELVSKQRAEKNLVGLAAMVMVDGEVEAAVAHGQRKYGSGVPLEIDDRWHIGGATMPITATMIARLVEAGQMRWSDTVGDSFADAAVHDEWKPVTLKQLLTHTAGAKTYFSLPVRRKQPKLGAESTKARREAVLDVLAVEPEHAPGTRYAYSGVGYTIAGAMVEQATGTAWSELVKREVFQPLKLNGSGFGPPKSPEPDYSQPRGHSTFWRGKVAAADDDDNTFIIGPAAIVHMTLKDLCNFALHHLRGELGQGDLLSAETYKSLHTPESGHYAVGWVVKEPSYEIPHKVYWHNGTNTFWYALVVFIPEKNMVVAVTSNDGDWREAEAAAWEIVNASANQFRVEKDDDRRASLPVRAFPKKSPFSAVRWQDSQPEVEVAGQWYRLAAIDDLPADEIVSFSQATCGVRWRKRFEEDLVGLLAHMKHMPGDTVDLRVESLDAAERRELKNVPMTKENRRAIRDAANARDRASR